MPSILSSLLNRTRTGMLMLLLVVLPLQGVVQLVAGLQGHRHMHTGATAAAAQDGLLSRLSGPLRLVLDHLHAAQDPRLQGPRLGWTAGRGSAVALHAHGSVMHRHAPDTADVVLLADPQDDAAQGGGTAFLAWLPSTPVLPVLTGEAPPATAHGAWRDRVVAPALAPPRG